MHISLFKVQRKAMPEFTFLSETNCNCLSPNPGAELFLCSSPGKEPPALLRTKGSHPSGFIPWRTTSSALLWWMLSA